MRIRVQGGTNAGVRKPYTEGHSPTCMCVRCDLRRMRLEHDPPTPKEAAR